MTRQAAATTRRKCRTEAGNGDMATAATTRRKCRTMKANERDIHGSTYEAILDVFVASVREVVRQELNDLREVVRQELNDFREKKEHLEWKFKQLVDSELQAYGYANATASQRQRHLESYDSEIERQKVVEEGLQAEHAARNKERRKQLSASSRTHNRFCSKNMRKNFC